MEREFMLEKLNELIHPIITKLEYKLYFIEYVEEDGENYLRIYIEKDEGITLQDCEKVSRAVSDMLDDEDPIPESYYLEVSSPGVYRTLFTDEHLERYLGYVVAISLKEDRDNSKKITGELKEFNKNNIKLYNKDSEVDVPREKIKEITLEGSLKEVNDK